MTRTAEGTVESWGGWLAQEYVLARPAGLAERYREVVSGFLTRVEAGAGRRG
jgi:hypothetical protein